MKMTKTAYTLLSELYYKDRAAYESVYQERLKGQHTVRLDFMVKGNQAFFVCTPEIYTILTEILRMNQAVINFCGALPRAAIDQFSKRCLIDEIVLTNSIEGVISTRKEISDILDDLEAKSKGTRFYGLVRKYTMLMTKETLPLNSCQDVRDIYDELVLAEVTAEETQNAPDGKWFRKDSVSVYNAAQKEIHRGVYPEEAIIRDMEKALAFLNGESCDVLFRIAVFHYLLGYIHPFYDGNGRLSRFICSYLLSQELAPVTGYRLAYTIKENIKDYYRAFVLCNNSLNRGDLTPFLEIFLNIIKESVEKLKESLQEGFTRLNRCRNRLPQFVKPKDLKMELLYDLLIQAALFSEFGVSTEVVQRHIDVSRTTLTRKLRQIPPNLLVKEQHGRVNYYSLNLDVLEQSGL